MKEPTFAAAYVAFYPMLAEIARDHGYALAIHGSVSRDFDLVAIPWTKEAVGADELMVAITRYVAMFSTSSKNVVFGPELKEHGRAAWSILIGHGAMLDLSIMPRVT